MNDRKEKPLTLGEVLRRAIAFFKSHNVAEPRLDAEVLLAHVLEKERIELYVDYDLPLSEEEKAAYRRLVASRAQGKPVAYLVGKKEFMSLEFAISEEVLIPRPETEFLVEMALDHLRDKSSFEIAIEEGDRNEVGSGSVRRGFQVLELGTGSGAVAVAIVHFAIREGFPLAQVYAVDQGEDILAIARENAVQYGIEERVIFLCGDLFSALDGQDEARFDMIVSNPPYIPSAEIDHLRPEIKRFEPRNALDGGDDGLDFYRRITDQAPDWLNKEGVLLLEMGAGQREMIEKLLTDRGFEVEEVREDYTGIPRVIRAIWS